MAYLVKDLIAANVKKYMHSYRTLFENIAENSRQNVLSTLPEGSTRIPAAGVIYGDEYKQRFTEKGNELRSKALGELDELRKQVSAAKTKAPSDEAVRAIQVFQQRNPKSLTREQYQHEAEELCAAYGDNYMAFCALRDIAREGGAHVPVHPLVADIEAFDALERNVRSYFNPIDSLNRGCPSAGKEALAGMVVDELLGIEESAGDSISHANAAFTYDPKNYSDGRISSKSPSVDSGIFGPRGN